MAQTAHLVVQLALIAEILSCLNAVVDDPVLCDVLFLFCESARYRELLCSVTQESAMEAIIHACQAFMHKPANATNVWKFIKSRRFVACNPT
jgi:hypothetical protein